MIELTLALFVGMVMFVILIFALIMVSSLVLGLIRGFKAAMGKVKGETDWGPPNVKED